VINLLPAHHWKHGCRRARSGGSQTIEETARKGGGYTGFRENQTLTTSKNQDGKKGNDGGLSKRIHHFCGRARKKGRFIRTCEKCVIDFYAEEKRQRARKTEGNHIPENRGL